MWVWLSRHLYNISWVFECMLVGCWTSQQHASVSQGSVCSDSCTCCHTEAVVADQTFYFISSHSILTPGQPIPALTLQRQAPGRVATLVPIFKSLVWLDLEKSQRKWELNHGSATLKADALTTRPARQYLPVWRSIHESQTTFRNRYSLTSQHWWNEFERLWPNSMTNTVSTSVGSLKHFIT